MNLHGSRCDFEARTDSSCELWLQLSQEQVRFLKYQLMDSALYLQVS
jgi:hypothetical protein